MLGLVRRIPLERAVQLALAATMVTTLLAAGSLTSLIEAARTMRWAALIVLVVVALAFARRGGRIPEPVAYHLAAAFAVIALASASWSAAPSLTVGRAGAFALVLVAAAALAYGARSADFILQGVLLGAVVVAVGGLLVLAFRYDRAVQAATTVSPARYQGLGGGPNMAPMVLALAVPIAFHYALCSRRFARAAGSVVVALLLGSIAFSGSRGGLTAAVAGLAAYSLLRRRLALVALAGVLAIATLALLQLPSTAATNPPEPTGQDPFPAQVKPAPGYLDANLEGPRLQDDIGHPGPGVADPRGGERSLLGSSGRTEAWRGAVGLAADRPVAGYGFGTEDRTFVDRYVFFNSGVPENSYLGVLLQLGVVGLALLVAVAVALLRPSIRAPDPATAAAAAAFVAALVLGFFQSYLYAAGNSATAAAWVCGFAAVAGRART